MTGEDSNGTADDKPPTGSNNVNGFQQSPPPSNQPSVATATLNPQSHSTLTTLDASRGSTISSQNSPSGKKTVFFSKPETDSGVALPAETAAEAEAVLQAIAADEKNGDKSESDNEQDDVIIFKMCKQTCIKLL